MALGREMPLALWNDISRCPIAIGDLTFSVDRLHMVVAHRGQWSDWWMVVNDQGIATGIAHVTWAIRPFQNVTVRKRLERAVRTVQRRWRARRLARVLRPLLGLGHDLCDVVAGHAVGAPLPGGFFPARRR